MDLNMEWSDDEEDTRLRRAMIRSQLEPLRPMLREPTTNSETILALSLRYECSDDLISTLIEAGCGVNGCMVDERYIQHAIPLHFAVLRRTTFITRMLLEYGADVLATNDFPALHVAIMHNRHEQVLELLKWHDCPLDSVRARYHRTPLMMGLLNNSSDEILLALLNHGCDLDAQDQLENTALHYCADRRSTLISQKIIENGASLNIKNYKGHTPLHLAASAGNLDYVCMLLYYNASADEEDNKGWTPFRKFICNDWVRTWEPNNAEAVTLCLLEYVSDIEAKCNYGYTVLEEALRKDPRILMQILEKGGVNINNTLFSTYRSDDILSRAWKYCKSYKVLTALWSRTNFEVLLETNVVGSFLGAFCNNWNFSSERFIQYLYMMFDSPYIEKFISRRNKGDNEFIIEAIVSKRDLTLNMRLELIWLFLSYDVTIYFIDVCALYEKYGFDESVLLILMQATNIRANPFDCLFLHNILVRRICFDNIDEYIKRKNENLTEGDLYILDEEEEEVEEEHEIEEVENHTNYCRFYTATFCNRRTNRTLNRHGISPTGQIPSLLELSRDTVRRVIYKRWNTPGSFYVYQALSQLPVPPVIKDILYLKTPIYL